MKSFVDNVQRGQQQQPGLHKRGKVLKLSVPVRMLLIRWLIGYAHGQKRDHRGNQIQPGVQRLRQHTQAARADHQKRLQRHQQQRRAHAQQRRAFLLPAFFAKPNHHGVRLAYLNSWRLRWRARLLVIPVKLGFVNARDSL